METFLNSIGSNQYPAMAKALVTMGATAEIIDIDSFAKDLEKIFTAVGVIVYSILEINSLVRPSCRCVHKYSPTRL